MYKWIMRTLPALFITLPLVFIIVFLGYFPVHYDVVLHTDNIVGEGICKSYGSRFSEHMLSNEVTFYFGSELKQATIKGALYDVRTFYMVTSDVTAYDVVGIDIYVHGVHLRHLSAEDILPDKEVLEGEKAVLSSQDGVLHVDVHDPNIGSTLTISRNFIPTWFWIAYFSVMLLIAILLALLLGFILERYPALKLPLMSAACVAVALLSGMYFCDSLPFQTYIILGLNWLLLLALAMVFNALTLPFLGTLVTMLLSTGWYIANYFVIILRGKPILPADLKAVGTAAEVMGGYTFTPSGKMILGVAVVVLYGILLVLVWKKNRPKKQPLKKQLLRRGISVAAAVLIAVLCLNTKTYKNMDTFAWDNVLIKNYHEQGAILSFLKSAANSKVKKPEGYSREFVNSYLADYASAVPAEDGAMQPTRIIMVMNEAFSDLRSVGLDGSIDVMPFIDSLDENVVEGSLYVSIFGGGTCNTEFEGLTGNTLAFLSVGAYPYTENVTEPIFSLASYFKSLGYGAEAFHANEADNWNRSKAYPNMGFEAFHSIEDYKAFGEVVKLHGQAADVNDYLFMEAVDAEYSGEPRFLFNVTMQNHSPYDSWLDVEKAASVAENGSDLYVDTQIYLSLIKASDEEVRQLVETYRDSSEPTMIVFFGDHQPALPGAAISEIYTNVRVNLDLYKSKFFIWTNYDTPEWLNAGISANYLPWLILERGNFPLPPYVQLLKEVYEKYPVISSQGVIDAEGNIYGSVNDLLDDPLIRKYQYVQYANLFDEIDQAWFEVN